MPREKKVSFNQKLASYDVLIEDTSVNSDYFKVSQFPEGFTGGKNGFLLAGTPFLVPNSRVLVEVVNVDNQTIYYESIKDYTEGNSKLISFEIYENTPPGLYKVILLGQARSYANGAAIPSDWAEKYNVRWTRDIVVEPRRRNISPIRFKSPPRIFIESEKIIYTPSSSYISEIDTSAHISLSPKLKSTLADGYTVSIISGSNFTDKYTNSVVTGSVTASVDGKVYTTEVNLPIHNIINQTHAQTTSSLMVLDGIVERFLLKSGSYEYLSPQNGKTYQVTSSVGIQYSYVNLNESIILDTGSYARLRLVNLGTNTGEVYKTEISYKIPGTSAEYVIVSTPNVSVPELLVTSSAIGDEYWVGTFISGGLHNAHNTEDHWYSITMPTSSATSDYKLSSDQIPTAYYTASVEHTLSLNSSNIFNGVYPEVPVTSSLSGISVMPYLFGTKDSYTLFASSEYTLAFTALFSAYSSSTLLDNYESSEVYVYLASSEQDRVLDTNPLGQLLTKLTINPNTTKQYFEKVIVNFNPQVFDFGKVSLRFIATNGFWEFSNISIKPAEEFAFNPDETSILVPNYIDEKTISYKARFFDINGNSSKLEIESSPITFTGPRKYVKRSGDTMYGELYINEVPIQQQTLESSFTGLLSGGVITVNSLDNTKYDISAGYGYIVDNYTNPLEPTYQLVSWSKFEGITPSGLGSEPRTNIAISASGEIYEQPEAFNDRDYREYIVLGRLAHVGTAFIQRALSLPLTVYNRHFHWYDLASAISPLNVAGNVYSPSGSSMQISKTSGETYRIGSNYRIDPTFPDITADTAVDTVTFAYRWRSGSGFVEAPSTTIVTASLYDDDSGTLALVQNNRFTVQRIYFFGATNTTRIQFGQTPYNSMADAITAANSEVFEVDPNLSADATLRAFMIVKGDATDLSDPLQATFIPVNQFGAGGGSGGGGASSLATLTDVSLNTPVNNDVLTYSSASGVWVNRPVFPYSGSVIITGSVTASAFMGSLSYNFLTNLPTLFSSSAQVDHDTTTNFVANEHIDHTTVSISAGSGLSGGGTIAATRTLTLDTSSAHFTGGVTSRINALGVFSSSAQVAHNSTTGYVANEHINHTSVSITAGSGLSGGGTIAASRTLTLDTSSVHFLDGVKKELNTEGVYSSSAQLVVSSYTNATNDRVVTSTGTGGINAEANLTFGDGGGNASLSVGSGTQSSGSFVRLNAPAGQYAQLALRSGTQDRWVLYRDNTAESGGQNGSQLRLASYDDSGVFQDNVISFNRATGSSVNITRPLDLTPPTSAVLQLRNTLLTADTRQWSMRVDTGELSIRATSDTNATQTTPLTLYRTGTASFSGNVGVGTTTPSYKLDVNGSINATSIRTSTGGASIAAAATTGDATVSIGEGRSGNGYAYIDIVGDTTYTDFGLRLIRNNSGPNASSQLYHRGTGSLGLYASEAASITLSTNATEHVRVDSSGNVGIGTASPGYKLDITGTTRAPTFYAYGASAASSNILMQANSGASAAFWMTVKTDSTFHIGGNGGSEPTAGAIMITSTGNVGIGTTSPSNKLEVNGSFAATTKSFLIDHPTKPNHKLQYGSLESPYHGVRLTGNGVLIDGMCEVELPEYICGLVREEDVSIQLTNNQHNKNIWVEKIDIQNNKFIVKTTKSWFSKKQYKFFWSFTAVRKDVPDMEVEFQVKGNK